jgi:hypothetical protein
MRVGELADDRCKDCGSRGHPASDPHFSTRWIGQEFNVSDALLQLVKRSESAFEECAAIDSGFDPLGATIEKPHTKRMLEIGDHLGNAGLRYPEVGGRLCHASTLHHGEEKVQIAKPQAPANLAVGIDISSHIQTTV